MPGGFTGKNKKYNGLLTAVILIGFGIFCVIVRYTLIESATKGTASDKQMAIMVLMFLGILMIIGGCIAIPIGIIMINRANQRERGNDERESSGMNQPGIYRPSPRPSRARNQEFSPLNPVEPVNPVAPGYPPQNTSTPGYAPGYHPQNPGAPGYAPQNPSAPGYAPGYPPQNPGATGYPPYNPGAPGYPLQNPGAPGYAPGYAPEKEPSAPTGPSTAAPPPNYDQVMKGGYKY